MSDPLILSQTHAVRDLESICESNRSREVQLPSGRSVLVSPFDGLAALAEALDTPAVRSVLRECAAQFAAGEIEPLEAEAVPARKVPAKKAKVAARKKPSASPAKRGKR